MRSPLLFFCLLSGATCQRVDEPAPPAPPAETTPAQTQPDVAKPPTTSPSADAAPGSGPAPTSSTAAASETVDAGRCITPLAEPPPPVAKPAKNCPADPLAETPPKIRHGKVAAPEAPGAPVIDVEIADTPASEQRGLMYRTKLGREDGMLFVWTRESRRTFWMHNTCLPLDMLFLAKDGTIVGLLEQVPTLNDAVREVGCPAAYVLEVNAGWSRRHGVKPGMKLDLTL